MSECGSLATQVVGMSHHARPSQPRCERRWADFRTGSFVIVSEHERTKGVGRPGCLVATLGQRYRVRRPDLPASPRSGTSRAFTSSSVAYRPRFSAGSTV